MSPDHRAPLCVSNSSALTEIRKARRRFLYLKGYLTLDQEDRQDLTSVSLRIVTIVADMTIRLAMWAETDIGTLDRLRLLATAIILHLVAVLLAICTMIGETIVDHHRLPVMMAVLLTLIMIIPLAMHMDHALDTDLPPQGMCMTDALLTVTRIRLLVIALGHLALRGDVMIFGACL